MTVLIQYLTLKNFSLSKPTKIGKLTFQHQYLFFEILKLIVNASVVSFLHIFSIM